MVVDRWYVRCLACLSVAAVEEEPEPHADWTCAACGGRMETMGRVSRDRKTLFRPELQVACDGRCTGATGTSCNCRCGGENHGTGRLVEVDRKAGDVPHVMVRDPVSALCIAEEWRSAKAATVAYVRKVGGSDLDSFQARAWISSRMLWERSRDLDRLLIDVANASALRSHSGRLRKLESIRAAADRIRAAYETERGT